MTSKALINNSKLFKKRDASVDNQLQAKLQTKMEKLRIQQVCNASKMIATSNNNSSFLGTQYGAFAPRIVGNQIVAASQQKYIKSNNCGSMERAAASGRQIKQHSRMGSLEFISSNGQVSTQQSSS